MKHVFSPGVCVGSVFWFACLFFNYLFKGGHDTKNKNIVGFKCNLYHVANSYVRPNEQINKDMNTNNAEYGNRPV